MSDWDENSPGDSDIVSQYPANERAAREAVRDNFGVDHHEENDADVGKHEVIQILDNAGSPTIAAGEAGVWNDGGTLNARVGTGTATRLMRGESGTKMMFYQAAAPTGWTQDTSVNDRVLRVVDGSGGASGGSWTISGVTVDNHTLTISEMPSHDHSGSTTSDGSHSHSGDTAFAGSHDHELRTGTSGSTTSDRVNRDGGGPSLAVGRGAINHDGNHNHSLNINNNGNHNHSLNINNRGGGNGHNHGVSADGNWRPSYIDVIAATLD